MHRPATTPDPRHRGTSAAWHGRHRRRAMTVIELCVGMMVTAMVLGALSALWFAVGEAWRSTGGSQAVASTASQASVRLETAFRQARLIIKLDPGSLDLAPGAEPASAFIWRGDYWNTPAQQRANPDYTVPLADGAIQTAELGLLEHDPAASKIYLYRAKDAALMTADQRRSASDVPTFLSLKQGSPHKAFQKLPFVDRTVIAEGVTGLHLNTPDVQRGSRPVVEVTVRINRKGMTSTLFGTAVLRSPSTVPTY